MSTTFGVTVSGLDTVVWNLLNHTNKFPDELRNALGYLLVHLEQRTVKLPKLRSLDNVMEYGTLNKQKILKENGYTFSLFILGPNSKTEDHMHKNKSEYLIDLKKIRFDYFLNGEVHCLENVLSESKYVLSVKIKQK